MPPAHRSSGQKDQAKTDTPSLFTHPIHLGRGATAMAEPAFTDLSWYADYVERHAGDGAEGRLVSLYRFSESWDSWEMHPHGHEIVLCTAGTITLIQQAPGEPEIRVRLTAGDYAINAPGVWHTADVEGEATALFITAGWGTEHRPR